MKWTASSSFRGLLRAALVECARNVLPPDEPEVLRALAGLGWRAENAIRHARADAFLVEARRLSGVGGLAAEALAREAQDVDLQRRLEELVLGRVEPQWLERYAELSGVDPLDAPALYVALGAPHPLVGVRALAAVRPGLCALHPASVEPPSASIADRWMHRRFTELRLRVPVLWATDVAAGSGALAEGRGVHAVITRARAGGAAGDIEEAITGGAVLGLPLDRFLAQHSSAPIRLVLVHRERDKRWRVEITPPVQTHEIAPKLAAHVRRWPGQHLPWLAARVDGGEAPH
ncbi:hypothetical protein LBMAG42_32270 [Deltaproteobacteria bacterium]|nr:hypothetical protein LBMAG42_32270 [Deltaproteobacteria bacterium]